jgi:hypothetical protein
VPDVEELELELEEIDVEVLELEEAVLDEAVLEVLEPDELELEGLVGEDVDELLLVVEIEVLDVELDVDEDVELLVELVLDKLPERLYKPMTLEPPHSSEGLPEQGVVPPFDETSGVTRELLQSQAPPDWIPKYVYGPDT